MGLITKVVKINWNGKNKKWYESKGYHYTKMHDKFDVKVEDLQNGSGVFVNVSCDCENCKNPYLKPMMWKDYLQRVKKDGKYYCQKCAIHLYAKENLNKVRLKKSKSFEKWCIENNRQDILHRWDYELNKCLPNEITYSAHGIKNKGYWFKCDKCSEHKSELKNINNFIRNPENIMICNQCNSIVFKHPELIKYFKNKSDAEKYSAYSNKKVAMKCPDCGYERYVIINTLLIQRFSCPKCGDGYSYPNKFMFNILEQLHMNFINEYSPSWIKPKRYDFYFEINNKKYIVEMDGGFHYKDNNMSGQTKEESKQIDNYKDILAKEHNIQVIRINCRKSELEYIKNNILHSKLNNIFDLSNIDWLKCEEFACSNLTKVVCNLWTNGLIVPSLIAKTIKINSNTVRKYLKRGTKLGWCDYVPIAGKHIRNI